MPIVYIDESQLASAKAITSATREEFLSLSYFKINSYSGPLTEITFVTHTDLTNMRFLDQSPEELAKAFSQAFHHRDKSELQHIFLIACSATLPINHHPSLAQQFAKELHQQGFTNALVHAITSPYDIPAISINVGVANNQRFALEFAGDITASAYGNTFSQSRDELDDAIRKESDPSKKEILRSNLSKLVRSNSSIKYCNPTFFLSLKGTHKDELLQPYHTYTKDGVQGTYSYYVAVALMFISKQKVKLITTKNIIIKQKYFEFINKFTTKLHSNSTIDQQRLFELIAIEKQQQKSSHTLTNMLDELIEELNKSTDTTESKHPRAYYQPHAKPIDRQVLLLKLESYVTTRKREWDYHYNFLGVLSVIYFIFDKLTGTDYFKCFQKNTKISAANKLIDRLKGENPEQLNYFETIAVTDSRLGSIVDEYGGVDRIWSSAKSINNDSQFQQLESCNSLLG